MKFDRNDLLIMEIILPNFIQKFINLPRQMTRSENLIYMISHVWETFPASNTPEISTLYMYVCTNFSSFKYEHGVLGFLT